MRFVDLRYLPDDIELLVRFYEDLFIPGFPDEDERESIETFRHNLVKREAGFYGDNNYHILMLVDGDRPVAVSIFDYLAASNCGAIEYILVAEDQRGKGLGWKIHERSVELMRHDALKCGQPELNGIMLEVNDPFKVGAEMDIVDPFERVLMWQRWGYRRLRFPYQQPALSAEQSAIDYLLIGVKVAAANLAAGFPPELAKTLVVDYLVWANRLTELEHDPFYRTMSSYALGIDIAPFEDFDAYIGRDAQRTLRVCPLTTDSGPEWEGFLAVYHRHFRPGPTVVEDGLIATRLARTWFDGSRYHVWALASAEGAAIQGMATFFSMPGVGFLGYLALDPELRGRGLTRVVCKRIEEQLIRSQSSTTHWYVECEPGTPQQAAFEAIGFRPLPVVYRAPPVGSGADGMAEGPAMTLLRKRLGDDLMPDEVSAADLRRDILAILRTVFDLQEAERSTCYQLFSDSLPAS